MGTQIFAVSFASTGDFSASIKKITSNSRGIVKFVFGGHDWNKMKSFALFKVLTTRHARLLP